MSLNIKENGALRRIAGSTVILDATASEIREGNFTMSNSPSGWCTVNITFDIPMPDTEYVVNIESSVFSGDFITPWRIANKTINGFELGIYGNVTTVIGKYYAIRLVNLEGYTEVYNKVINSVDSTPTENSTNLVTSGGVYDAIKNASSIFVGTAAEWETETNKADFNVALITDAGTVNAVDDTTGDTEVVANKHLVFKGTLEEWEALTTAEKKTYDEALITNDMDTGEVVNEVTDGDMRAVTSNAVYDTLVNVEDFTSQITFTNWETAGQVSLRKCGKLVTFNLGGHLVSGQISTDVNQPTYVGTIPANCLPDINAQFAAMTIGGVIMLVSINAYTGKIGMTCPSSAVQDSWAWGSVSYFTSN